MIAEAHGLGLPVVPWTVNTTADMARLMDLGVDGIITDYPTRLRTLMEERGLKLPKAYEVKG
jgi:glycerophosphoryl diester phosphodiesterase